MARVEIFWKILVEDGIGARIVVGSMSDPITVIDSNMAVIQTHRQVFPINTTPKEVFTLGQDITTPSFIVIVPTVDSIVSWKGTGNADNSSVFVGANTPLCISGKTTQYDTTPSARANAASQTIDAVYARTETGAGSLMIFVV